MFTPEKWSDVFWRFHNLKNESNKSIQTCRNKKAERNIHIKLVI